MKNHLTTWVASYIMLCILLTHGISLIIIVIKSKEGRQLSWVLNAVYELKLGVISTMSTDSSHYRILTFVAYNFAKF